MAPWVWPRCVKSLAVDTSRSESNPWHGYAVHSLVHTHGTTFPCHAIPSSPGSSGVCNSVLSSGATPGAFPAPPRGRCECKWWRQSSGWWTDGERWRCTCDLPVRDPELLGPPGMVDRNLSLSFGLFVSFVRSTPRKKRGTQYGKNTNAWHCQYSTGKLLIMDTVINISML